MKLNLYNIYPIFFGPYIAIIVHSFELPGTNTLPASAFSFLGGGHSFDIILPDIRSISWLFILPYAIYRIVRGIKEFRICTMKGQGFILR